MNNFDDIVTDKKITFDEVWKHYKEYPDDASLYNKYVIVMTSGTTGEPIVLLWDRDVLIKDTICDYATLRKLTRALPIISSGTYSIERQKYESLINQFKITKNLTPFILNSQDSYDDILDNIIKYRARNIGGYTSEIRLIAAECIKRGYDETPLENILCSGENLTEIDKQEIQKAFPNAKVRSMYACTEAGTIAMECKCGHLHINEDRLKIEPVDLNYNVLPYDVESDQTLLTVYSNRIQPIIRYVLGDKITLHKDCPCGCNSDWIEINGRAGDLLYFDSSGDKSGIASMNLMICMDECFCEGLENFSDYQIILHENNKIELRLEFIEPCNHNEIFENVKDKLSKCLNEYGIEFFSIELSDKSPETPTNGQKKRRVYMVK